jgi:DNA-directed RNA polymerase II subunit RPB1
MGGITIKAGVLLKGCLTDKVLGTSHNSLVQILSKEYSNKRSVEFVNNYQYLTNHYLLHRGFSVGMGDCLVEDSDPDKIPVPLQVEKVINKSLIEVEQLLQHQEPPEILELKLNNALSKSQTMGDKLSVESIPKDNSLRVMISSGAKGKFINITQILALVGQQTVDGNRIPKGFRGRTLPHYPRLSLRDESLDLLPETKNIETIKELVSSRGMVLSSYYQGLTPQEFFFHAMGGRIGVLDTAVKVSRCGYLSRRMVKSMEDLKASYAGTVTNSRGTIVSFCYGDDNMDASQLVMVDKKPQFVDVKRLVDKLMYELETFPENFE